MYVSSYTYFLHLLLTLLYSISQEHEDEVLEKSQNQVKLHDAKVGELNKISAPSQRILITNQKSFIKMMINSTFRSIIFFGLHIPI
jgi:hypothetical protein